MTIQETSNRVLEHLLRNHPDPLKHIGLVALLINLIIPVLLRLKSSGRFDTRPLEIVFHGFMFGVYGTAFAMNLLFVGIMQPFYCNLTVTFDLFDNVLTTGILLVFLVINLNTLGILLSSFGGNLSYRSQFEHLIELASLYLVAPLQLDQSLAGLVYAELIVLIFYSAKKVMESTSSEIRQTSEGQIRVLDQIYSALRLGQAITLIVHGYYNLQYSCGMLPKVCYIQIAIGFAYFVLWVFTGRQSFQCERHHSSIRSKRD